MATVPQVTDTTTFYDWRTRTNDVIDLINLNKVGSPTLMQTVRDMTNYLQSAGVFNGCSITDNGNGTVNVSSGEALLRADSNVGSELFSVAVALASNKTLTDEDVNYVYVDYNAGAPQVLVTVTSSVFNSHDKCLIAIISREGNNLTILEAKSEMVDSHNKINDMLVEIEGFKHVLGGTSISESGTRKLSITTGDFYRGLNKYTHAAYDTNVSDTFEYYHRLVGDSGWVETTDASEINVLKYDDNSGTLATITAGKFAVQWIYMKVGSNQTELFIFYGQGQYDSISEAQLELAPTNLPAQLDELGVLIGRVAFEYNSATINIIESAFSIQFKDGQALSHNNVAGIQGGIQDEYYHFDEAQYNKLNTISTFGASLIDDVDADAARITLDAEQFGDSVAMSIALG